MKLSLDVNFYKAWQQSFSGHFFEWLSITLIRLRRQDNDAPKIKRIVNGAAGGVLNVKERLEVASP